MLTAFDEGFLPEADGHQVKYWQYGNPNGTVILTLHGGPGSCTRPRHINSFDLTKYRVVAFDQRGAGESLPPGKLEHNTTQDLLDDVERLRNHLHIDSWFVTGSSWGSTLALAYAEAHPEVAEGLLLSNIYLCRKKDNDWSFAGDGVNKLFPDLWEHVKSPLTPREMLAKIEHGQLPERNELVARVLNWEGNLISSQSDITITSPEEVTDELIPMVTISLHYLVNNYFLQDNQLLKNIDKIKDIPTMIVHGRYDLLCPAEQAWDLHQALPKSQLLILPSSNHHLTAEGEIAKNLAFKSFLLSQGV